LVVQSTNEAMNALHGRALMSNGVNKLWHQLQWLLIGCLLEHGTLDSCWPSTRSTRTGLDVTVSESYANRDWLFRCGW